MRLNENTEIEREYTFVFILLRFIYTRSICYDYLALLLSRISKAAAEPVKSMPTIQEDLLKDVIQVDPLKDVWKFFDHVESNNQQEGQVLLQLKLNVLTVI